MENGPETPRSVLCEGSGFYTPWYRPEIGRSLRAAILILFEKYCDLLGSELENHLY